MASLIKSENGTFRIMYRLHGKRMAIYAGKMEPREASRLYDKVEELVGIRNRNGRIEESESISKWLGKIIGTNLHTKLVNAGLLETVKDTQLGSFCEAYIASRTDIKQQTRINLLSSKRMLVEHFGAGIDLRVITPADVSKFKAALMTRYANATTGRTLRRGRQFFAHAVDAGIINRNPFDKLKIPNQTNISRLFFVDRETCQKVLDACPNLQWRLIFSLARFGGLRIPSELIGLLWSDVLWAEKKIRVPSPKTEHIEGKDHRWVPLFPEIMEPLRQAFDIAKEGDKFIFPRTITGAVNLRKGLNSIIKKAGLSPWPKLFQNLRASRETELCQNFPLHVASKWIGNTPTVAMGHYLQVIDSDWEKATKSTTTTQNQNEVIEIFRPRENDAKNDALDAKTTHFTTTQGGSETFASVQELIKILGDSSVLSTIIEELQNDQVPRVGIEPTTS